MSSNDEDGFIWENGVPVGYVNTSLEALKSITKKEETSLLFKLVKVLEKVEPEGLTTEEAVKITGIKMQTASPLMTKMRRKGISKRSGRKRKNLSGRYAHVIVFGEEDFLESA